jgi:hypothetical protein
MAFFRYSSAFLLGFLSVTALVGAFPLLTSPDGEPWDMPQSLLDHSPFHSFLIPGIVLVIMNGLMSLFVLWLTLRHKSNYGLWIAAQGCVLFGWLTVECLVLRMVLWPHYFYGVVALLLVVFGYVQRKAPFA